MNTVSMLLLLSVALDTSLNAVFGKWGVGGGAIGHCRSVGKGGARKGGGPSVTEGEL